MDRRIEGRLNTSTHSNAAGQPYRNQQKEERKMSGSERNREKSIEISIPIEELTTKNEMKSCIVDSKEESVDRSQTTNLKEFHDSPLKAAAPVKVSN